MTSGLAAVLFGVLPLYVALLGAILPAEPLRPRLLVGIGIAIGGLVLAFGESLDIGGEHAGLAAGAVAWHRSQARSATSRSSCAPRRSTRW